MPELPPVNMQSRVVVARTMIALLNHHILRRVFIINATEEVIEFDILNNTVTAKIIDKLKVAKLSQDALKKGATKKQAGKFALGRISTLQLNRIINLVNGNLDLKAKLSIPKTHRLVSMLMHGKTVTIHIVDQKAEEARKKTLQQQAPKA